MTKYNSPYSIAYRKPSYIYNNDPRAKDSQSFAKYVSRSGSDVVIKNIPPIQVQEGTSEEYKEPPVYSTLFNYQYFYGKQQDFFGLINDFYPTPQEISEYWQVWSIGKQKNNNSLVVLGTRDFEDIYVIKFDSETGEKTKEFYIDNGGSPGGQFEITDSFDNNNNLYFCGNSSTSNILYKFDENLDLVWAKQIMSDKPVRLYQTVISNNYIYVTGTIYNQANPSEHKIFITKLDLNGTILSSDSIIGDNNWNGYYDGQYQPYEWYQPYPLVYSTKKHPSGGIVISFNDRIFFSQSNTKKPISYCLRYNEDRTIAWQKKYIPPFISVQNENFDLTVDSQGNSYIIKYLQNQNFNGRAYVTKFDQNGVFQWSKRRGLDFGEDIDESFLWSITSDENNIYTGMDGGESIILDKNGDFKKAISFDYDYNQNTKGYPAFWSTTIFNNKIFAIDLKQSLFSIPKNNPIDAFVELENGNNSWIYPVIFYQDMPSYYYNIYPWKGYRFFDQAEMDINSSVIVSNGNIYTANINNNLISIVSMNSDEYIGTYIPQDYTGNNID